MDPTPDELAGVVDMFGALTRSELHQAFEDLTARTGARYDAGKLDDQIDTALHEYYLVEIRQDAVEEPLPGDDDPLFAPGPVALPTIPDFGEDLPHIMSISPRSIQPAVLGRAAEQRLRSDAARAVADGDEEWIRDLMDTCFDLEAWAGVNTDQIRDRLSAVLE